MYSVGVYPTQPDPASDPLLKIVSSITTLLNEKKYVQAIERFGNFVATINENCCPEIIEKVYAQLFMLIENADSLHMIQVSINKLLEISSNRRYELCQQDLALKLAKWHFKKGKQQNEKVEKIQSFTNAIHYIGKARCFPRVSFEEIDCLASRIFRLCAVQFSVFQDRLTFAVSFANKQEVLRLVGDLEKRFTLCCEGEKNVLIKQYYKQISALYNQTFRVQGPERLEASGLKTIYFSMEERLNEKVRPHCFLTAIYRQTLDDFRREFAARYEEIRRDPTPTKVRDFQGRMSDQFIAFLQRLIEDSIALVGDFPCLCFVGFMGSIARGEPCPRSDVEWYMLIEDEKYVPYFQELARTFDLQINSLGENAALGLPVFSCIGIKHRSGLHVDTAGNPVLRSLLSFVNQNAWLSIKKLPIINPILLANTLRKTHSFNKNPSNFLKTFRV